MSEFRRSYPELLSSGVRLHAFTDSITLSKEFLGYDIAVATIYSSVKTVLDARVGAAKGIRLAYYVQDYEPLFHLAGTEGWREARDSYQLMPNATLFAKTEWICDMVEQNHGVRPVKVAPSLDHRIYYPNVSYRDDRIAISAMIRPHTPRRAPRRTARVLNLIADEFPRVSINVFGCSQEEAERAGIRLSPRIVNHGRLRRTEVPGILRETDLFLDASDYQAFGRTGLEAMATGCIPVLPSLGGAYEYAVHQKNAFLVDTRSDADVQQSIRGFLTMKQKYRSEMRAHAIKTSSQFSITRAAVDELLMFEGMMG
ncbi:glycosyltransferase [Brevundimonas sp.]|uniref:glycosyltransferase n=1 Tax=Brevundimonas sp. TaxID=1871086 RepID=UPI0028A7168D|nr:glycosyltransferase [Brevundimonas sp.]